MDGVQLYGHPSHFRLGTLLLNPENGPMLAFVCHCPLWPTWNVLCLLLLKLSVSVACNMLMAGYHAWLNLSYMIHILIP
jgi:hypothetical protein